MLDSSKLKEFADNNSKFNENGRKFSKWVENTVGKREIALDEQFLFYPPCFQKTCTAETSKPGLFWERGKCLKTISSFNPHDYFSFIISFTDNTQLFSDKNVPFQIHFPSFPPCVLPYQSKLERKKDFGNNA